MTEKVCPIILRREAGQLQILCFEHPFAGRQFVKGTVEAQEDPAVAAARELFEESGLVPPEPMAFIGASSIGPERMLWHFFVSEMKGLTDTWNHQTLDDGGHVYRFFWHPFGTPLDDRWHALFLEAYSFVLPRLPTE